MDGERPGLNKAGEENTLTIWMQMLGWLSAPAPCFPAPPCFSASPLHFHHHLTASLLIRGKSHLPYPSDTRLYSASPIANLACAPPLSTTATFGSRTYPSSKESPGWKQGHLCIKALPSDSIQPTQARFQRWVWDSWTVKSLIYSSQSSAFLLQHINWNMKRVICCAFV